MCFLASLTVMNISCSIRRLLIGIPSTGLCLTIAISQHFSFIATYSWLNVVCFGVWRMFRTVSLPTHKPIWGKQFFYSSVYGWGIPLVIVVVGQIVQNCDVPDYIIKPGLASKMYCWFDREDREPKNVYLYGPIVAMVGANYIMIIWAGIKFCQRSVESSQVTNVSRNKQRFKVILNLFLLMCMPWSVGVIVCVAGNNIDYEILRTSNILWPIFIFIIFVCKPSVWKMLKLKFPWISPFLSTCEKLGSKIICMKSKHQPLVTVTRNQLNSINMAGISGKFTQIGYQRHTESTV
ncbi:G-protein coupled receptor Mth2-like [Daphnia pulex]|uniref:G-protein coupled receptor Mth2-like n=1 Tax=Daphnia pulex TaxID=6669 RepID=UPI001EDE5DBC|nr:G-protein coupled receptor Mth2-like [Daphnia pulex]XP_046439756.1 G-protein coupled receptor Mth2-like [Daphnia pulex]